MKVTKSLIALSFSVGLLSTSLALPAHAAEPVLRESSTASISDVTPIVASSRATVPFERPSVSTSHPKPVVQTTDPVVVVQSDSKPESVSTLSKTPQVPTKTINTPTNASTPVYSPPIQTAPVASGKGSIIAAAALAQLGVEQDCTALVSNALAAAGIHFHGWPADYMSLGTVTSTPVPGDLIYYANGGTGSAHIAVYIGNGQAVHGGWNGGTTAIYSANIGSGPVYIHI